MKNTSRPKTKAQSDRNQVTAFRKAARELGCDENEERFRDALRTVVKHKPQSNRSGKHKRS